MLRTWSMGITHINTLTLTKPVGLTLPTHVHSSQNSANLQAHEGSAAVQLFHEHFLTPKPFWLKVPLKRLHFCQGEFRNNKLEEKNYWQYKFKLYS